MTHRRQKPQQMSTSETHEPCSHISSTASVLKESQRDTQPMIRLAECGDVLRIADLARVLDISVSTIEQQERVGGLGTGRKYRRCAKADVQRFLEERRHARRIA